MTLIIIQLLLLICLFMPTLTHQILTKLFSFPRCWARYWGRSSERGDLVPWTRSSRCSPIITHKHINMTVAWAAKKSPGRHVGTWPGGQSSLAHLPSWSETYSRTAIALVLSVTLCDCPIGTVLFSSPSLSGCTQMNGGGDQRDLCGIL